ncbi:MAG: serine/threonine protein kinase [Planctomycetota bacterium]|nr:serine/threonine protein kinase [Planctomycetota bacterium]
MTLPDPLAGKVVGGCRVVSLLGAGAMGRVYRAVQESLEREVALKILPKELASDVEFITRFLREAKAIAQVSNPNIVQVFDAGLDEESRSYYIMMELVRGRSLDRHIEEGRQFSFEEIYSIMGQCALGLAAAHRAGIIHRDIKPANLMVGEDLVVKIADFGLAKSARRKVSDPTAGGGKITAEALQKLRAELTDAGAIVGTPAYMSPEQCLGHPVDARSDLYSLGATFYYLIGGRPPFSDPDPLRVIYQHLNDAPTPLDYWRSGVPAGMKEIVKTLLAKHPALRYRSCEDLYEDVQLAASGKTILGIKRYSAQGGVKKPKSMPRLPAAKSDPKLAAARVETNHGAPAEVRREISKAILVAIIIVVVLMILSCAGVTLYLVTKVGGGATGDAGRMGREKFPAPTVRDQGG